MAVLLLVLDLRVGDGGLAARAPVDHARAAVHQALLIQAAERLAHGLGAALVHGEALAAPVAGDAHAALLVDDASAVILLPLPGALQELLTAQALLGQALLGHRLHDLDLGRNGGVVGARQPEGRVALHAVIADQRVLQGAVHRVAHVQLAGDVGWRHHDGEGLLALHAVRGERAGFLPLPVQVTLDGLRVVNLLHFHTLNSLSDDHTNSQLKCLTERIRFFALTKPSEVRRTGGTLNVTRQSQSGKDGARIKPF